MTRKASIVLSIALAFGGVLADAGAQDSLVWNEIDCAQSPIVAPTGLKCRATNENNGSSDGRFTGQGVFKNWSAYGIKDGVKLYYLIYDTIGSRSSKTIYRALDEEISSLSPYAKRGKGFSPPAAMSGADYSRFTGEKGDACVAIRKPGPVQGRGYKWVLFANMCVAPGKTITDENLGQFISAAAYRS